MIKIGMWVGHESAVYETLSRSEGQRSRSQGHTRPLVSGNTCLIGNRGRRSELRSKIFDRKQNQRYFCACALKKSPKHSENVFRQKSYSPVTGNHGRRSEWPGQTFDTKLPNSRFCACAMKMCPKLAYCVVKSPQF